VSVTARTVRRLGWVAFVALLSTVLAAHGCSSEGFATAPTRSPANPGTGAAANPAATRAYLESIVTTMEANSIYRDTIDWVSFRARVMAEASNAQSISELSPAIRVAVSFKGRPDTRFFGQPTCGHHHIQVPFRLSDGAVLHLVASQLADRLKRNIAGPSNRTSSFRTRQRCSIGLSRGYALAGDSSRTECTGVGQGTRPRSSRPTEPKTAES
jgi:hypothetical protein